MPIHLFQTLLLCSTALLCLLSGTAIATPLPADLSVRGFQVPQVPHRGPTTDTNLQRKQECERFGFVLKSSMNPTTTPTAITVPNGIPNADARIKDIMAVVCAEWGYVAPPPPTQHKSLVARSPSFYRSGPLETVLSIIKHTLWFLKSGRK